MAAIVESARHYEDWLRAQLHGDFVEQDLDEKHDKMRDSPFVFLRATYWRWAETILDVCPDLADGAPVLAVGDIHLENYGTWRDADGRLAWGVNDFDEAAEMPYGIDLVRLAASALLGSGKRSIADAEICAAILQGYRQGLRAPRPIVLDRDMQWLRELVVVSEAERAKFWKKIAAVKAKPAPERYLAAIADAMPEPQLSIKTARRVAGTGSLGRPRWVGIADWRGAPIVREAKALVTSAWCRAHGAVNRELRAGEIANGRFRPLDPWYRIVDDVVVRRLSPNNRKIEVEKRKSTLFTSDMLQTMGFELANVHLGTADRRDAIKQDLKLRKRGWLTANARKASDATVQEYKDWKAS
jgi:hypothetical protein